MHLISCALNIFATMRRIFVFARILEGIYIFIALQISSASPAANHHSTYSADHPSAPSPSVRKSNDDNPSTLPPSPLPLPALNNTTPRKGASSSNGTLDPSQAQALLALGLVFVGPDPCNTASQHTIVCDETVPFRRIVSLQLEYCAVGATFPLSAWSNLSSLKSLAFVECPAELMHLPTKLTDSLTSLTCTASLGRSVDNVLAPGLPGIWLSQFHNLVELSVSDVEVNASSNLDLILAGMKQLQRVTFSNTNLTGAFPWKWPSKMITSLEMPGNEFTGEIPSSLTQLPELEALDLSSNKLTGPIPEEWGKLGSLQFLSLASNSLTGPIPGNFLQNLTGLIYMDLSGNHLNGSIPTFLSSMQALRYVDLRNNNLQGEIPLSESYLETLNSMKLSGNPSLCYNGTIISARLVMGVQPCDSRGLPVEGPGASPYYYLPTPSPLPDDPFEGVPRPRGPSKAVIVIALALACIVGIILSVTFLSRRCPSKP